MADLVDQLWSAHGVEAAPFDVFAGDVYVDSFPAALRRPGSPAGPARLELRPDPFQEPSATAPPWVGPRSRRLVYLTLGTVVASDAVLRPVVEGLAGLDADVLVALGSATGDELGPRPPHVHVVPFVDQAAVLRVADLAVHHGGSGTLLGALVTGTPQLLLPTGADQVWNAALAAESGLAAVLEPDDVDPDTIARLGAAELGSLRPAAGLARDELARRPSPADVVADLTARVERTAAAA